MKKLLKKFSKVSRGDTIVEVMIGLVVLAVAIATVYGISTRSLSTAVETKKRTEALGLAQSQVDYLIAARQAGIVSTYQTSTPYCIPSYGAKTNAGNDNLCDNYNASDYNVGVVYSDATKVFTITAQWPASRAPNGIANLNLYYKLPG
jgi:Tfp pilus assembly protein PilV